MRRCQTDYNFSGPCSSCSAGEVSIGVARESPSSAQRSDPLQAEAVPGGANPVTNAAQEAERARQ